MSTFPLLFRTPFYSKSLDLGISGYEIQSRSYLVGQYTVLRPPLSCMSPTLLTYLAERPEFPGSSICLVYMAQRSQTCGILHRLFTTATCFDPSLYNFVDMLYRNDIPQNSDNISGMSCGNNPSGFTDKRWNKRWSFIIMLQNCSGSRWKLRCCQRKPCIGQFLFPIAFTFTNMSCSSTACYLLLPITEISS